MAGLLAFALVAMAPPHPILDLWPQGNPGGWTRPDKEVAEEEPNAHFKLVRNVSHPTLEIFEAANAKPHSPTVLVCPGGGYSIEAIEHEGWEIAARLNRAGFNAAVLKYRLPNRDKDKPLYIAPLQDAQRAIRLLRFHAAEYRIDPDRVGVMGFSAGGHLSAATSNAPGPTYSDVDAADSQSPKPAFTVLVYPAYLDEKGHPDWPDNVQVSKDAPPAFIVQTMDDPYGLSAFAYALDCHKVGVPAELHVYPHGGHGYGIRTKEPGISGWMDLLIAWLKRLP